MVARRHKDRGDIVYAICDPRISIPVSNRTRRFRDRAAQRCCKGVTPGIRLIIEGNQNREEPYSEHDVSGYAVTGNEVGGVGIARSWVC